MVDWKDKFLNKIVCGDCLELLKEIPDNSVDSIITDPPYEIGFMGKKWDNSGIAYNVQMWKEVLRVLKPGGYLLSFGGSRTYHRMACAIEDSGFEIRDMIEYLYSSGFPKSLNVSKAIDKMQGVEFKAKPSSGVGFMNNNKEDGYHPTINQLERVGESTEQAKEWEGWGTALKPAHEPICMARKPLSERTVAENVLKHGTGGINIDECRIGTEQILTQGGKKGGVAYGDWKEKINKYHQGRFPANLILDEEAGQMLDEQSGKVEGKDNFKHSATSIFGSKPKDYNYNGQSKSTWAGASRFFYCAKASKSERNAGCEKLPEKNLRYEDNRSNSLEIFSNQYIENSENPTNRGKTPLQRNNHPTVKPIKLMEYLIKLVTQPKGIVLDCFAGSGSTGVACAKLGRNFIGIEISPEYCKIAESRLKSVPEKLMTFNGVN